MTRKITRLGILGSGQLARMLALAAAPLGIECEFFDEAAGTPCKGLGTLHVGNFSDESALAAFAQRCDVVTYEFENVPCGSARCINGVVPVYPPPTALEVSQDRLVEKEFFRRLGVSTPRFANAESDGELSRAISAVGVPCVVKTRRLGYDGKGQAVVRSESDAAGLWTTLGGVPLIVEEFLSFDRELSVLAVRSTTGEIAVYPLSANVHREGILRRSEIPAPGVSAAIESEAHNVASKVLQALDYVGIVAIELFEVGGKIVANEMAPRVHNSGHATIDGSVCSQFENHVRAVCGIPLGAVESRARVVMLNLIGSLPATEAIAIVPNAKIHLYGKEPRPGRKVGHVTLLDPTSEEELVAARIVDGR